MDRDRSVRSRRLGAAFRVVCVLATVAALCWFLRGLDLRELAATFRGAEPWPLLAGVSLNFLGHAVRAQAWQVMLGPRHPIRYPRLLGYELAAQAASAISPARAGEVLRFWLLKQDDVPAGVTGALIVLKKVLGGVGLVLLAVWAPWFLSGLPGWVGGAVLAFTAFLFVQFGLLLVVAHRARPDRLPKYLRGVVGGMYFLRDRKRMPAAAGLMLLGEVTDAAAVLVVLLALGIHLPIPAVLLTLFLIDFSNMLPVAPGHVGTFEVGALYAMHLMNVPQDGAFAFALLFHAQQVLPQILAGLPLELRLLARRRGGPARESTPRDPAGDRDAANRAHDADG